MKSSTKLLLAGGVAGGVALVVARPRRRRPTVQPEPQPAIGDFHWVDPDAPRRIRALALPIEQLAGQPGLGDYLAAISYTESRGNVQAGSSEDNNAARGWFGIRPKSARLKDLGLGVDALKDEPMSVALAAWYAFRCRPYAAPGQVMDWHALRRCWGYPKDVPGVDLDRDYAARLAPGLAAVGLPKSFLQKRAFPDAFSWPGIEQVIEVVQEQARS